MACSREVMHTMQRLILRFPKITGTILGGPHNKDGNILGVYWGPPILGNYHIPLGQFVQATQAQTPQLLRAHTQLLLLLKVPCRYMVST